MYHISKMKFKGFKSFKNAYAQFPKGFIALAGPNGSGKSNVADAIRFCFGEMGTKAIRVKRASELVNINCSKGEVTIWIEGDTEAEQAFEICRTVDEGGTTNYHLNGRHLTRTNVLEALRPYGLEIGHHNIVGQGQVQRIVEMNPKERREIIDSVAGISEFEQKKKEALGELGKVESKISEAKVILAERGAHLNELEKDKDSALQYMDAKTSLERARATLINSEYQKLNTSFEDIVQKRGALIKEIESLDVKLAELEKSKFEIDGKRKEIAAKIEQSAQKETIISQIQDIRVQMAQKNTLIEQKLSQKTQLLETQKSLESQRAGVQDQISQTTKDIEQKNAELKKLKPELAKARQAAGIGTGGEVEKKLMPSDEAAAKLSSLRESKAAISGNVAGISKLLEQNSQMLSSSKSELTLLESAKEDVEIEKYAKQIEKLNSQLNSMFDEEKKLNKQIPELDRSLLDSKEKAATLRGSVSPAAQNPALTAIASLKEEGKHGIYGTVNELISVDEKFQPAAEACAGSRLNYVIVDTLDNANSIIQKLKSAKSGRASFIPLDTIILQGSGADSPSGSLGRMIDFVKYPAQTDKAMRYIFEDTLLVNSVDSAKKIGIGKFRMTTMGGELLERSGIISGGANRTSLMARAALQKAEEEISSIKTERDSLYSRLYSVREEMQKARKERAELELSLRTKEAETGTPQDRKMRMQKTKEEISKWQKEVELRNKELGELNAQLFRLSEDENKLTKILESQKMEDKKKMEEERKKLDDAHLHHQELFEKHSFLSSDLETKISEQKLLQSQFDSLTTQIGKAIENSKSIANSILQVQSELETSTAGLKSLEERLSEVSASVQKHYAKMQALQAELDELGKQCGILKYSHDNSTRQVNELNIKHATVQTRLVDVKAEWEKYQQLNTAYLEDMNKGELEELAKSSELKINSLGNVNLKAPELFEEKKKELAEVQGKVDTLGSERTAVVSLITELEQKKLAIFNETFNTVNGHFKRLFSMVFRGEGSLVLDESENPLESGMSMRVRGENEKRDRYLESMSGGEKTLLSLMFVFALQMKKPAPFYILDEAEASLDKSNALKMADFLKQMSKTAQFIVITHSDAILSAADVVLGVSKGDDGSKIVGVQLTSGSTFVQKTDSAPMGEQPLPPEIKDLKIENSPPVEIKQVNRAVVSRKRK